jgi:hypothetical protein
MDMNGEYAKNEKDYIDIYQDKGYIANFYFKEGKLINTESKREYSPNDIYIVAEHRYEGMSNPSDMSILYVIKTSDGERGTFLMAYGPEANFDDSEFFRNVPESNISDNENINLHNTK